MIWWILAAVAIGVVLAVRLAPTDAENWHKPIEAQEDKTMAGGAIRLIPGDAAVFAKLDEIARATPRTQVIAGTVEEGRITYQTRSLVMGFPDYTTVELAGDQIKLFARLRFGSSDLGVNAKRLEGWLGQL